MNIEYIDGEKIVTHDSGIVSIYTIDNLNEQRDKLIDKLSQAQNRIDRIDDEIVRITESEHDVD